MKKFIVCLTLACLASLLVARAGEGKSTNKAANADKAKVSSSAKTTCSEKAGCGGIEASSSAKSACCEKEKVARKVAKPDEKGATFLVKR